VPDHRERAGTHSTTASGTAPAATVVGAAATTSAAGTTTAPAPAFTVAPRQPGLGEGRLPPDIVRVCEA
jgi:hypothetical protein